jgi:drug/metabolite transporter (DMT)-like permease
MSASVSGPNNLASGVPAVKERGLPEGCLLVAAIIWGAGFVAQKIGMEHMGPWSYTGFRYAIAALGMLPLLLIPSRAGTATPEHDQRSPWKPLLIGGGMAGLMIAIGGDLQQAGIERTTAGKAGFITGLYVILVPLLGLFVGYVVRPIVWIGACIALAGLYFLSVQGTEEINTGDVLVFLGTFAWAAQVLIIGWASPRSDPIRLAVIQTVIAAILTLIAAAIVEGLSWQQAWAARWPLLYSGILATSVAFTLQIIGQRKTPPALAAILLSLEAVFAAMAGWALLHEELDTKQLVGCGMMLTGILLSQMQSHKRTRFLTGED